MLAFTDSVKNALISPVRQIKASVSVFNGDTLAHTYAHTGELQSISVERIGDETKFVGYGVVHKCNFHLRDTNKIINLATNSKTEITFETGDAAYAPFPYMYISRRCRDENTGELSITAYDLLYQAPNSTLSDVGLKPPYTLGELTAAIATHLGATFDAAAHIGMGFDLNFPEGANVEGTENLKEILDDIAEATVSIYYLKKVNGIQYLTFKRLDKDGDPVLTIRKDDYITLEDRDNRRIGKLIHTTELGDNVDASSNQTGTSVIFRDNVFWNNREDVGDLVLAAFQFIKDMTINQFECSWRGNYALEIGDKIAMITKDNTIAYSYILDDVITYNGSLSEETRFEYENSDADCESSPANLGEVIKQTYARVDKANKQIDLVVSDKDAMNDKIT